MTAVGKVVESASQLHSQLSQAASVKDLFLLKQEILNQQEVLRKVFFRVVRFCDKENGLVPEALGEIISSQGMKDVIERLTMANWSDPSDFKPFLNELKAMRRAFEVRTAADAELPSRRSSTRSRAAKLASSPPVTPAARRVPPFPAGRRPFSAPPQMISRISLSGSLGNLACGSAWYQNATEAMSSWSGR